MFDFLKNENDIVYVTEGVAAKFAKVQASNTLRAWKRTDTYIT